MSLFAGVTVVTDGEQCSCFESSVAADAGAGATKGSCWYHLLVINNYSRTKKLVRTGRYVSSGPFMAGGHRWCVRYFPNGDHACAGFVSLYVCLLDNATDSSSSVGARFDFSFVGQDEKQRPNNICETTHHLHVFSSVSPSCGWGQFIEKDALEQPGTLRGDCLAIRCDIAVVCNCNDEVVLLDMGQHLRNLLVDTKVGADVTFKVGGEIFDAHRCVLAARSTVFMAQLFGPMKDGTTASVIEIKDMEARVFRGMLSFIYTDSMPKEEDEVDVHLLEDLLVAADRYDLKRLNFLCGKKLSEHIGVSSVASTLALAERHHCRGLKEACFQYLRQQSPSCLQTVMASSGWDHITTTYPTVLNELIAKLITSPIQK